MFKLLTLIATAVLISGCSYHNEALELATYENTYTGKTVQNSTVSLISVTDARIDKTSIGHVEANGQITGKLFTHVSITDRYKDGLTKVLKAAKFNLVQNPADANTKIDVKIKEIQIIYNDTNKFNENLHGTIVIEVTQTKGDTILTQTFTQKQGKWIKPSYTTKDIEPFLYELFAGSINAIGAKLAD